MWDVRHCSVQRVLEGHNGAVFSVDLDENSELAFTASGDKVKGEGLVPLGTRGRGSCLWGQCKGGGARASGDKVKGERLVPLGTR